MISYQVYKIVHIAGIMLLFLSMGGLFFPAFQKLSLDKKTKKPWMIMHGISLFIVLLGGFGLLARLNIHGGFPLWIWLKLAIWAFFGGIIALLIKKQEFAKPIYIIILFAGIAAAYFANYKPL